MKNYCLQRQACTLLAMLLLGTSCNGQVKQKVPKAKPAESKVMPAGQPKLVKTQGSHKGDNVHCSLQDKAGNLWFGTTGEGIYKYDGKTFTQFTAANGIGSNTVHCMLEDKDGTIWVGTAAGAFRYNGNTFTPFQIGLTMNMPSIDYHVFSILQSKNGKLWFATVDGVYIYDGKIFTWFAVNEGVSGFMSKKNNVEYILEDDAGNMWFGGRGNKGVFRYDGRSITNLKPNGDSWAWPVLQDAQGHIWFSNWQGAYRYDGSTFTSFTTLNGLATNTIARMIADRRGTLWFGCNGDNWGLCRYDGKAFTCFTARDGLVDNDIWSILEDKAGNIWVHPQHRPVPVRWKELC